MEVVFRVVFAAAFIAVTAFVVYGPPFYPVRTVIRELLPERWKRFMPKGRISCETVVCHSWETVRVRRVMNDAGGKWEQRYEACAHCVATRKTRKMPVGSLGFDAHLWGGYRSGPWPQMYPRRPF